MRIKRRETIGDHYNVIPGLAGKQQASGDNKLNGGENMRKQGQSQEEYCKGCVLNIACNVILEDDESCEDKFSKMCGDCLCFQEAKSHLITGEDRGGRICPAIQMPVYPMYQACDSFDFD